MYVCLAAYGDHIASLLETSDRLILMNPKNFSESDVRTIHLDNGSYDEIIKILHENNVDTLICGAVAACIHDLFVAQNINVIPWITGNISDIIDVLRRNRMLTSDFQMPGRRKRRRFRLGPPGKN